MLWKLPFQVSISFVISSYYGAKYNSRVSTFNLLKVETVSTFKHFLNKMDPRMDWNTIWTTILFHVNLPFTHYILQHTKLTIVYNKVWLFAIDTLIILRFKINLNISTDQVKKTLLSNSYWIGWLINKKKGYQICSA